MKSSKRFVYLLSFVLALPLMAESTETKKGSAEEATADDQGSPAIDQDKVEQASTAAELAGRIESISEAFTEARGTLEALNRLRIAGYVQAQYVHNEASTNALGGGGATSANQDTFSVRRGRINFQYQLAPTSRLVLQPDFASSGVALRDAYAELTEPWTPWKNTLTAGQFKVPFGFEIRQSSRDREMPERTLVIRTLFPGERDRGAMFSGAGFGERFNYRVGVFNGNGTAQSSDLNKRKDIITRLGVSLNALDLGVSAYRGKEVVAITTTPMRQDEFDKDRFGVDFQYVTPLPGLGLRGEYIRGTQPPATNQGATATKADVDGWYFYAIQNVGIRHQFVVRVDQYDPNTDVRNNATRTIGGSYIFHWDANSKVMFTYEQPKREIADPDDNLFTVRYQFSF